MTAVTLDRPWLSFDLQQDMQVLSWAINKPGFVTASRILWREVSNADLPKDIDVKKWLRSALKAKNASDAVCFLTSRDITHYTDVTKTVGEASAKCVATIGLGNAERVGHRVDYHGTDWGTINIAVALNCGMTQTGLLEGMSIATQARTAAIYDANLDVPSGIATGTGTDCIALAAPKGPIDYAGLHTAIGEAIGAAVYQATFQGAQEWVAGNEAIKKGETNV